MRRNDWLLAGATVLAALGLMLAFFLYPQPTGQWVTVAVEGRIFAQYPLAQDATYRIETAQGYNLLQIENRQVKIVQADCPDGSCTHQQPLGENRGGSIVCLPHHLVVTLDTQEEGGIDALVQ